MVNPYTRSIHEICRPLPRLPSCRVGPARKAATGLFPPLWGQVGRVHFAGTFVNNPG